jgi:hypothetical protein
MRVKTAECAARAVGTSTVEIGDQLSARTTDPVIKKTKQGTIRLIIIRNLLLEVDSDYWKKKTLVKAKLTVAIMSDRVCRLSVRMFEAVGMCSAMMAQRVSGFRDITWQLFPTRVGNFLLNNPSSLGEDASGELYICDSTNGEHLQNHPRTLTS